MRRYNKSGVDILQEDWDNLFILDACRYDIFAENHRLSGELQHRYSRGSSTPEFLRANFTEHSLKDTVYVTANPQWYYRRKDLQMDFHRIVNVWREEGWDEETGTVLPETVTEYAKGIADQNRNKRLIVHYMQPHFPFIESDSEFDKTIDDTEAESLWERLMTGDLNINRDRIWELYVENLKRVLPYVEELMAFVDGKTVVTADHGNMIGERSYPVPIREWGHPRGIYTEELVKVPWLIHEDGYRRTIRAGGEEEALDDVEDGVVADRLEQLGYR